MNASKIDQLEEAGKMFNPNSVNFDAVIFRLMLSQLIGQVGASETIDFLSEKYDFIPVSLMECSTKSIVTYLIEFNMIDIRLTLMGQHLLVSIYKGLIQISKQRINGE